MEQKELPNVYLTFQADEKVLLMTEDYQNSREFKAYSEFTQHHHHLLTKDIKVDKLCVLAAIGVGQLKAGVELGPEKLLALCTLEERSSIVDPSLLEVMEENEAFLEERVKVTTNETPIKCPTTVAKVALCLHESVYEAAMKHIAKGYLPKILTFGGDHTVAIGSISAISNLVSEAISNEVACNFKSPDLIVFWIDAHADINTPATTKSGSLHGCPVSLLTGIGYESWDQLSSFNWIKEKLKVKKKDQGRNGFIKTGNLVYIGLRDVNPPEQEIIRENNILEYSMVKFKSIGRNVQRVITEALLEVDPRGECPIHISFDIDGIDPKFAPSTGTAVIDGLLVEEGVEIITSLLATGRLVSMDLVEVNPSIGSVSDVERTLATASKLIMAFSHN